MKKRRLKKKWKYSLLVILLIIIFSTSYPFISNFKSDKDLKNKLTENNTTTEKIVENRKKAKLTLVGDFLFESLFIKQLIKVMKKRDILV